MRKLFFLLLFLGSVLFGCARAPDVNVPPEIYYGEDICEECGMIISEPRFAAAIYRVDGTAQAFDDIGGMSSYLAKNDVDIATYWVHDYETEEWLKAENVQETISQDALIDYINKFK
jgi:copper chaperone NosL